MKPPPPVMTTRIGSAMCRWNLIRIEERCGGAMIFPGVPARAALPVSAAHAESRTAEHPSLPKAVARRPDQYSQEDARAQAAEHGPAKDIAKEACESDGRKDRERHPSRRRSNHERR